MLERMWSKGNTPPLMLEVQTSTATVEISTVISQKIRNQSTSRFSNTTFGHIPKGGTLTTQGHVLLNYVHNSITRNARIWQQPRCPSAKE